MKKHDYEKAVEHFHKAFDISSSIDKEIHINSLNKLGRIYTLQQQYTQAREGLELAIKLAGEAGNFYQKAESLIDLVPVLEHLGEHLQALECLEQSRSLAREYHYYYLLGYAEMIQGDQYFQQREYPQAFPHYGEFCRFMALYHRIEYDLALQKLRDRLFTLIEQGDEIVTIIDELHEQWQEMHLESTFPEFTALCEQIRNRLATWF